jgi:hypothetical protein
VDVLDAAEQAFSDAATATALTDRRYSLIGLSSGYSATGDLIAVAVLRSPASAPVATSPPAPEPVTTTAPPAPEPVVTTPPPAPEPVVTSPPAPAPSPVAEPADRKDARAAAKAQAKSDRFGKFTGEKAQAKLDRLQGWLDRALAR